LISIPDRKKAEAKRLKDKRMRTRTAEERLADAAKTSYTKCPPRVVRHYLNNNVQNIYETQTHGNTETQRFGDFADRA